MIGDAKRTDAPPSPQIDTSQNMGEQFFWIMLNPLRVWIYLTVWFAENDVCASLFIHDETARAGCSLINRKKGHVASSKLKVIGVSSCGNGTVIRRSGRDFKR